MSDEDPSEQGVLNESQSEDSHPNHDNAATSTRSRRTSSTVSIHFQQHRRSPGPSFRTTRKRDAGTVEEEDREADSATTTPVHAHTDSGESAIHLCICQRDPKIPRPRNAFILYRQHHQASVVAQNPGLANPEISKIIGEQWQNQSAEVKNKWKALAEEEKLRHQQQYPTYRYQPKRNGRGNSLSADVIGSAGEKLKCARCGGLSILTPSTSFATPQPNSSTMASVPPTLGGIITPIHRTLPVLKEISLQSPAGRHVALNLPNSTMTPDPNAHPDERDDIGPLSPKTKRRRYSGDHPLAVTRTFPPRYGAAPQGVVVGPGTPYPFGQAPLPPLHYPPVVVHHRPESLSGFRGMVSPPGPMEPPPRPGLGYQQHRLSQGHTARDRSLTLPPLQTGSFGGTAGPVAAAGADKTAEEQITSLPFRYKIKVLGQVAQPAPNTTGKPRGPLIAVEGDDADAVREIARWLYEELSKGDDLNVSLVEGPDVSESADGVKPMVCYHRLAADWLLKSDEILDMISIKPSATPVGSVLADIISSEKRRQSANGHIDEKYDDMEDTSKAVERVRVDAANSDKPLSDSASNNSMDLDGMSASNNPKSLLIPSGNGSSVKPVGIIANYSLRASNVFACRIPISANDNYSPSDHWQWTATQWRGIIGPDLTIFLKDSVIGDSGKPTVEMSEEGSLFMVKRVKIAGKEVMALEPSVLRRLGFEVGEWVRAFAVERKVSS